LFAIAWRHGGWARMSGIVAAAALTAGSIGELRQFYEYGRGNYEQALQTIAASESPTVSSNLDGVTGAVLDFHAAKLGLPVTYVSSQDLCGTKVSWFIEATYFIADHPDAISVGQLGCSRQFRKHSEYPYWGLAGWYWTLYRAAD
jgi:hypothetical protein